MFGGLLPRIKFWPLHAWLRCKTRVDWICFLLLRTLYSSLLAATKYLWLVSIARLIISLSDSRAYGYRSLRTPQIWRWVHYDIEASLVSYLTVLTLEVTIRGRILYWRVYSGLLVLKLMQDAADAHSQSLRAFPAIIGHGTVVRCRWIRRPIDLRFVKTRTMSKDFWISV